MNGPLCILLVGIMAVTHGYRLPNEVMPEHYKLEVITYLGEKDNFDFDGKVWIDVSPT